MSRQTKFLKWCGDPAADVRSAHFGPFDMNGVRRPFDRLAGAECFA